MKSFSKAPYTCPAAKSNCGEVVRAKTPESKGSLTSDGMPTYLEQTHLEQTHLERMPSAYILGEHSDGTLIGLRYRRWCRRTYAWPGLMLYASFRRAPSTASTTPACHRTESSLVPLANIAVLANFLLAGIMHYVDSAASGCHAWSLLWLCTELFMCVHVCERMRTCTCTRVCVLVCVCVMYVM